MKQRRTLVRPAQGSSGDGRRSAAVAALAALALIWGYNWVVMKIGLRYAQPFTFAALRTLLSALCLFVVMWAMRRPLRPAAFWMTALIGLFQTTGFVGLAFLALQHGGAGKVSVLTYTMPFWLLLLAWMVLGERVRGLQWVAVGLAMAGFLLILSPWRLHGATATMLAVGGGLAWAAGGVTMKALDRRRRIDLLSLTAWQMLIGSLPLALIAALTWQRAPIISTGFIWTLAVNVVLANALAWYLWHFSLRALPTGLAGFGTLAIPVVGVAAAWLQLGERPGLTEALGMLCIIGALALLTIRELRRRESTPAGAATVRLSTGPERETADRLPEHGRAPGEPVNVAPPAGEARRGPRDGAGHPPCEVPGQDEAAALSGIDCGARQRPCSEQP